MAKGTDEDSDGDPKTRPDALDEMEKAPPRKNELDGDTDLENFQDLENSPVPQNEEKCDSLGISGSSSQDLMTSKCNDPEVQRVDNVDYGALDARSLLNENAISSQVAKQEFDRGLSAAPAEGKEVTPFDWKPLSAVHHEVTAHLNPLPSTVTLEKLAAGAMTNAAPSSDICHATQQASLSDIREEGLTFPASVNRSAETVDVSHRELDRGKDPESLQVSEITSVTQNEEKCDSLGISCTNAQDLLPSKRVDCEVQGIEDVGYYGQDPISPFIDHQNGSSRQAAEQVDYDISSSRGPHGRQVPTSEGKLVCIKHDELTALVKSLPRTSEWPTVGIINIATGSGIDHVPSRQASALQIVEEGANLPASNSHSHNCSTNKSDDPKLLWQNAIGEEDCSVLKELLKEDLSCLWKYERKDRTPLDVAYLKGDLLFAKQVLDGLMKAPQREYFCIIDEYYKGVRKLYTDQSRENRVQERIHQMVEESASLAYEDEWRRAIELKDSVKLQNLAKIESLAEFKVKKWDHKSSGGRTALHIAAMQGCFPLAKQLLDLVKGSYSARHYITTVDNQSGLTAFQMTYNITGNTSISRYIQMCSSNVTKHVYFVEADTSSEWYRTLKLYSRGRREMYDLERAREVMVSLLEWNSRLLLETFHGATVLHLAIEKNDEFMVGTVLKLFGNQEVITWGASYYPSKLPWEEMEKISPSKPILKDATELFSISNFKFKSGMSYRGSALGLAKKLQRRRIGVQLEEYLRSKAEAIVFTKFLPEYILSEDHEMNSWIDGIWEGEPEWKIGFDADTEFNFETGPRLLLLRVHYAFKDPLKYGDFLKQLCYKVNQKQKRSILNLYDGQGRTPCHILMAHSNPPNGRHPLCHFNEILMTPSIRDLPLDARGRHVSDIFLTKEFIIHNSYTWSIGKSNCVRKMFGNGISFYSLANFVIFLKFVLHFKDTQLAEFFCQFIHEPLDYGILDGENHSMEPLHIVASFANQTLLQSILDANSDPMAVDMKGRTALHHAADATLLDLHFVNGGCYSTVEDLCEVRKKWKIVKQKGGELHKDKDHIYNEDLNVTQTGDDVEKKENVERKACILMLLQAGVDLSATDDDGKVPNIGPTNDGTYQSWWYDMVVKDTADKKNSFNQGGNALSVVGTLVAATSYIGPLQPPMNYDPNPGGFVHISENLVKIFMVTNTLAFYLAITAVMFAVVPSLSMPREGVMSELKRARHMVSVSLCLLLVAIGMIIISFASASMVVIQNEHSFHTSDLLFWPSIIGWFICFFGIASFLIRILRLIFYENSTIQRIYQLSFIERSKKICRFWWFYCYYFPHYWVFIYKKILYSFREPWSLMYYIPLYIFIFLTIVFFPFIHFLLMLFKFKYNYYGKGNHKHPY